MLRVERWHAAAAVRRATKMSGKVIGFYARRTLCVVLCSCNMILDDRGKPGRNGHNTCDTGHVKTREV
jgi:hypothetical protein